MKASDSTWNEGHEMQVYCKSLSRAVGGIIVTIYIFLNVASQQTFHKIHDCDWPLLHACLHSLPFPLKYNPGL